MRAYFRVDKKNEFDNINMFTAYNGFSMMGWEIEKFSGEVPTGLMRSDIVVGFISDVKRAIKNLGITPPTEIDYPEELNEYLGRKIWKSNIDHVATHPEMYPVFVKPLSGKQFDGRLVKGFGDLIGCGKADYSPEVWCSEPVTFKAEWRCFVRYDRILEMRRYKGDWRFHPNINVIEACLKDYINKPAGFTLDFGLTDDDRTLLIEVNDGFSCGAYGLFPTDYAKLISARWSQMVDIPDECLF